MTAVAGGMMIRRRWSTASSSGSLIQLVSPASRREAGSSCGGTRGPGHVPGGADRRGRKGRVACHGATRAAASEGSGQLVTTAYSVAPCAIVVPPESAVRRPEDLAGVGIGVGYHSGSHFATLQALEQVLPED